ncbi:hypothetical protein BKA70DRAFT_1423893 [Coprinopsis sp. MPI-PUGE-AT-0042]|nr:hypothetical protein BKA70DRAFT_1423893 [Coprinopsis sp. MPI-PUGE-AT-0042]
MDFLPRALPRLQHLDVRAPDPEHAKSFEDINAMAASFPDLKHFGVYVTRLMEPRDPNNPGKPQIVACPILKNLVELHVPAEWVERCFKASRGPGHVLPNLRRLEVTFAKGFEYSHPLDKLTRPCDTLRDIFNDISIKKRALGIPYEVAFNIRGVSPKALSGQICGRISPSPLYPFPMRDLYADPPPGDRTWMRWTKQFRSMKYLHIETVLDSPRCSSYMMRLARAIPPEVEERLEV